MDGSKEGIEASKGMQSFTIKNKLTLAGWVCYKKNLTNICFAIQEMDEHFHSVDLIFQILFTCPVPAKQLQT